MKIYLLTIGIGMMAGVAMAVNPQLSWPGGKTDTWHGFTRHTFTVDGCTAWVAEPKQAALGNPWTWCMEFPDAFTDRTGVPKLMDKGFYNIHIDVGNTFGCPSAIKQFDAFYQAITKIGLAKKGTLIGISRGGLYAFNWAAQNPNKVVCIYGDAAVCDFKSWPGGKGKGKGSPGDWQALIKNYHFTTEAEALAYKHNPIDNLAPLAKAKIPLIMVVGDSDDTVPVAKNTAIMEQRYKTMGGEITVIHKPGCNHHPHGLDDPQPLVNFILLACQSRTGQGQAATTWDCHGQSTADRGRPRALLRDEQVLRRTSELTNFLYRRADDGAAGGDSKPNSNHTCIKFLISSLAGREILPARGFF